VVAGPVIIAAEATGIATSAPVTPKAVAGARARVPPPEAASTRRVGAVPVYARVTGRTRVIAGPVPIRRRVTGAPVEVPSPRRLVAVPARPAVS
jgi:hypothetical protein